MRDRGRSAVYAAEDQISRLLDRGGEVDFFGSRLHVPMQRRFGNLDSVRLYLDALRSMAWGHGETPRPDVVSTQSERAAKWVAPNTIRIPESSRWAMTEMVILHEYAHHAAYHAGSGAGAAPSPGGTSGGDAGSRAGHGREFRHVFIDLVSNAIGAEVGLLLTAALDQAGVGMGDPASSGPYR